MKQKIFDISLDQTTALKGIALLLLLWHHLFFSAPDKDSFDAIRIAGTDIIYLSSALSRICVDIFLLLSGYGLTVKHYNKPFVLADFFKRRFSKLYINYWIIWLIFIPIGYFFFDRTIDTVYDPEYKYLSLFVEFFGIKDLFSVMGFNPTWWFYTCIIIMYLLFPILNRLNNRILLVVTGFAAFIAYEPMSLPPVFSGYFMTFLVGIWMARFRTFSPHSIVCNPLFWLSIVLVLTVIKVYCFYYQSERVNFALAPAIILAYRCLPGVATWIKIPLEFIGRHSMNIFLFHTFIYYYYCKDFIYLTSNPLVILLTLLIVCLLISVCIERIKKVPIRNMVLFRTQT